MASDDVANRIMTLLYGCLLTQRQASVLIAVIRLHTRPDNWFEPKES